MKKFIFAINIVFGTILLLAYALPFIPPGTFPVLSVLSLGFPVIVIINIAFLIYWLLSMDKRLFLSLFLFILGLPYASRFIQFNKQTAKSTNEQSINLLSYNVRLFNLYGWENDQNTDLRMYDFIEQTDPDILALQEFYDDPKIVIEYPFHYKKMQGSANKVGQIIYSKFPIIKAGSMDFQDTANNAIYADLKINKDTVRIYNIHLESLRISPNKTKVDNRLFRRLERGFSKQEDQVKEILAHSKLTSYKTIFTGDFNNTAFSYTYQKLKSNKIDAFIEKGQGIGRSFNFPLPLRIDFSLFDENSFQIIRYKQHQALTYSDHYPIQTWFRVN